MVIPWVIKRQLTFFAVFLFLIIIIVAIIVIKMTAPTCNDGKQNQDEQSVDCGGVCKPCVGEIKNLVVAWSKVFKLQDGKFDVAALIDNPNLSAGVLSLKYKFKLYDENNILVAIKDGEMFINPAESQLVFETGIDTGQRVPVRAFIELSDNIEWKRIEKEKAPLVVSKKQFSNSPFPMMSVVVDNKSSFGVKDIFVSVVLYDKNKNAVGVSSSKIDYIGGNSSKEMTFTWPEPFTEEPAGSDVIVGTNLTQ
ncbi:MAG: hypothetical protein WC587_02495 [Candidatus Paceibacterota bacterium]